MELIGIIINSPIFPYFVGYTIIGLVLGILLGSFCITFGGESNHFIVWVLAWPMKLIMGICNYIRNRNNND